jgi:S1-C subfamily serine protease
MSTKRLVTIGLALALALSALGVATVAARQDDGETAWLGVQISDEDGEVRVVMVVPGSPADEVGLRIGDVIVAVDETEIATAEMLVDVIQGYEPGDEVVLTIEWRGDQREVEVTLAARPDEMKITGPPVEVRPGPMVQGMLNIFGLEASLTDDGLLVESIAEDSPFAEAGLQEGDVITEINGEELGGEFAPGLMRLFRFGESLEFTVLRAGEEITLEFEMPESGPMVEIMPVQPRPTQLGVSYALITPELAEDEDLPVDEGALLREVYEGTPAAEAGLQEGDIILAVDGDVVDQERTLADRLVAYEEGDVVTLTVLREDEEIEVEVTLGPRAGRIMAPYGVPFNDDTFRMGPGGHHGEHGFHFEFGPRGDHPRLDEFFEAHPFLGEMFEHMFGEGRMRPGGGLFHFGPEGFHFYHGPFGAPGDAPNAMPDALPEPAGPSEPGSAA